MKKLLFLLSMLFCVVACGAKFEIFEIESQTLNTKRAYSVLFPDEYETSTNTYYPVIFALHGYGDKVDCFFKNTQFTNHYETALAKGELPPSLIITPQSMGGEEKAGIGYFNQPNWLFETFFFEEFLPHVEKTFRVKKEKKFRAITGDSMGGGGAIAYAQHHPELFAVCYAMSPWINCNYWSPEKDFATPDYYLSRAVEGYDGVLFVKRASSQTKENLKTVKWFVNVGDDDFLFECSSEFHSAMRKAGIPSQLRVGDGVHSWHYWNKIMPDVLSYIGSVFKEAEK